jgi:hypothetical protein
MMNGTNSDPNSLIGSIITADLKPIHGNTNNSDPFSSNKSMHTLHGDGGSFAKLDTVNMAKEPSKESTILKENEIAQSRKVTSIVPRLPSFLKQKSLRGGGGLGAETPELLKASPETFDKLKNIQEYEVESERKLSNRET